MWGDYFVRLKNELIEITLTIKRMIEHPLMMMLKCLWLVITFQEEDFINNAKKLAEKDRNNIDNVMPNEIIQGLALAVCTIYFFYIFNLIKYLKQFLV